MPLQSGLFWRGLWGLLLTSNPVLKFFSRGISVKEIVFERCYLLNLFKTRYFNDKEASRHYNNWEAKLKGSQFENNKDGCS